MSTTISPSLPDSTSAPLDVLVIGAGQAGLAVGHHLARHGLRFLLADAAPQIGESWRGRWDSLRLFTPAEYDALPGLPFPAPPGTYPSKDDVADYLRSYAQHFDLPVLCGARVERLERLGDTGFRVATSQGVLCARHVVVATGPFQQPHVPDLGCGFDGVTQVHSAGYRHPGQLPDGRVLVVGAGNSGVQIALELARTHDVHLAVGTRPRAVSQRPLGRDLFWWLTRTGAVTRPASSPMAKAFRRLSNELIIGTTWSDLDRAGVTTHARLTGARDRTASFADGDTLDGVSSVIWATGYRHDYPWLDVPGVWDGRQVHHERGRTAVPGLWFLGLPWQHSRGSALLGFVGQDAAWTAQQIVSELDRAIDGQHGRRSSAPGQPAAARPRLVETRASQSAAKAWTP
jgi:putative flavoprotein involved in K+ transport